MRYVLALVLTVGFLTVAPVSANATDEDGKAYYAVDSDVIYPVGRAAQNWNLNTKGITLTRTSKCTQYNIPCVNIHQRNVKYFLEAGGQYYAQTTTIYFDPIWNMDIGLIEGHIHLDWHGRLTNGEELESICHEFGHFLHAYHNKKGCMRPFLRPNMSEPDAHPYAGDFNRSVIYLPDWS